MTDLIDSHVVGNHRYDGGDRDAEPADRRGRRPMRSGVRGDPGERHTVIGTAGKPPGTSRCSSRGSSTVEVMAPAMAPSCSRRHPTQPSWTLIASLWPAQSFRSPAPLCVCKAGVRGSIPLVSTTLNSGNSHMMIHLFDQWHRVFPALSKVESNRRPLRPREPLWRRLLVSPRGNTSKPANPNTSWKSFARATADGPSCATSTVKPSGRNRAATHTAWSVRPHRRAPVVPWPCRDLGPSRGRIGRTLWRSGESRLHRPTLITGRSTARST